MIYRALGKTGLQVSLLGLGTGGHNPLGQKTGIRETEIRRLIHRALDLGINLFDTSPDYLDSELILGRALKGVRRDRYFIMTKVPLVLDPEGTVATPRQVIESVECSLRRLSISEIDVLSVGGYLRVELYDQVSEALLPLVRKLQREGKFRFLGSTEWSASDGAHTWLARALADDCLDVILAAYNLINQSAEKVLFPLCRQRQVGVVNIFTVRNVFSRPGRLVEVITDLKRRRLLAPDGVPDNDPLGWITKETGCSLVAAAYKFAASNDTVSAVMTGTIKTEHLEENARSIENLSLCNSVVLRLKELFGKIAEPIGD